MSRWMKKTLVAGLVVVGAGLGLGTAEAGSPSCHGSWNPPVYVAPKPTYGYQKSYQPAYRPAPSYSYRSHYAPAPTYKTSVHYGKSGWGY